MSLHSRTGKHGTTFMTMEELAQDTSLTIDICSHAVGRSIAASFADTDAQLTSRLPRPDREANLITLTAFRTRADVAAVCRCPRKPADSSKAFMNS